MALTGIEIFKLTPKKNCKECGVPTCMAFAMKVAQGAVTVDKCPYFSDEALAKLSEATQPPMKTITVGEYKLGGETVLYRHEKTFVSKTLYAVKVCEKDPNCEEALANMGNVDYERIGERMYVEFAYVNYVDNKEKFLELVTKAKEAGKMIILGCKCPEVAKEALAITGKDVILNGATAENYAAMNEVATAAGCVLGVRGENIDELYDTVAALEAAGNKNLVIDVTLPTIKEAFAAAVQLRRAALKEENRTAGYPTIVDISNPKYAADATMQEALATLFTMKYGSIVVMSGMSYAQALPLYGLRQNVYTDPQKPMRVEPGIYELNGATPDSVCALTVDFALSYFTISGEIERSGVPCNLLIPDAGGYSVLTAWAAGKLGAGSVAKFIEDYAIENKINNRTLIIPGKVAVLKGEMQEKLPNWNIVVGPNEAVQVVKFLRDL